MCYLMARAGARRIRLLESPWATAEPVEEYLLQANWEPRDILNSAPPRRIRKHQFPGQSEEIHAHGRAARRPMFPAFDLNHSYADCDVFVSLAKMKEHATAGVTLSMKNCFGITPCTIYGTGAGIDEPSVLPKGGRTIVHAGNRQPSKSAPARTASRFAARGHLSRTAHHRRSGLRPAHRSGDRRRDPHHDGRRRSVDS